MLRGRHLPGVKELLQFLNLNSTLAHNRAAMSCLAYSQSEKLCDRCIPEGEACDADWMCCSGAHPVLPWRQFLLLLLPPLLPLLRLLLAVPLPPRDAHGRSHIHANY